MHPPSKHYITTTNTRTYTKAKKMEEKIEEKKPLFMFGFKRLQGKNRKGIWKRLGNSGLRWKSKFNVHRWFVDRFLSRFFRV